MKYSLSNDLFDENRKQVHDEDDDLIGYIIFRSNGAHEALALNGKSYLFGREIDCVRFLMAYKPKKILPVETDDQLSLF